MSKKIYLSLFVACLCFLSQAQQKQAYYSQTVLTEDMIFSKIQTLRQDGMDEGELAILKEHLYTKLEKQRKDALSGNNQKIPIPNVVATVGCNNPDFENATTSGWLLEVGDNSAPGTTLPCPSCISGPGGIYQITSSTYTASNVGTCSCKDFASDPSVCTYVPCTNGIDNYGGFPAVAPGGNFSLLINDATCGNKMEKASQTFVVTNSNNTFTFQYALVMSNKAHPAYAAPYFHVDVTDNTTNSLVPCTTYSATAPQPPYSLPAWAGWNLSTVDSRVAYQTWKTVSLDLSSIVGHTVTVAYTVSDCQGSGHFGYAYIDAQCGQINTTNSVGICSGNNANLCGPGGYSGYSWTGAGTASTQCLSTSTAGNYTLNMTSATGCPAPQLTYTVTAAPAPTASMSIATTPCNLTINGTDLSSGNGGTITGWDWHFGDGTTASSTTPGNTQAHTYTASGNYTIVMTCTTASGCAGTYSTSVSLNPNLVTPVTSTSVSCNGGTTGSATVSPTGGSGTYNYSWSPSGGTSAAASGLGAGTYVCSVNDGAGCSGSATVTIAQPTPLSSTSTMVQTTCNQFNGSASINMSGGTGPYTYTWSPAGGNTSTTSGDSAGVFTCGVTDAQGCPYTTSVTITNKPMPAITSFSVTDVSCYNGTNGSATVTAAGTGLNYSWSPSGDTTANSTGLSNGIYTVTVTDVNNCVVTRVDTVNQPADIIVTSSVTASSCTTPNGSATVTATGGTGAYTYSWTSPAVSTTNTASSIGAGSYSCTVKDANGCTKIAPMFISTTTGPTVTVVGSTPALCNGYSDGSATVTASGTGTLTYSWSPSGGTNTTATGLPSGVYGCIVTDGANCISTATVSVNQPSVISTSVTSSSVTCNGGTNGIATVNASGGTGPYTYSWSPSGGINSSATGLGFGTYTCAILDSHTCTATATVSITQPTPITASATNTPVSCNGGNNGTATAAASGGTGALHYSWSPFGGTSAPAINLSAGPYVVTVSDANSCTFTVSTTVPEPSAITSAIASNDVTCFNKHNGTATVTPTGGTPGSGYIYNWTPSGGTGQSASNLNVGTFTCTIKDANGCTLKKTIVITQPTAITVTSPPPSPVKCAGASNGAASVNISGGTPSYTVTWSTSPVQTGTVATNLSAGSYTATITDANGCPKTKSIVINPAEPKDSLALTGSLCSTDPNVTLSAPSGTGISAPYQWYSSTGVLTGDTNVTYNAYQALVNDYSVTWYHNGCKYLTNTILETIFADLSTYQQTNVFTPNGDKINDDFYPFAPHSTGSVSTSFAASVNSMLKEYQLYVYDRWGKLIYSATSYNTPWDGKHAGKDVPDGTYFWIVNYKSNCNNNRGLQKIKGFVEVLR